eukprot:scaffold4221_cov105-Isochrysis_galbana.AAC.4
MCKCAQCQTHTSHARFPTTVSTQYYCGSVEARSAKFKMRCDDAKTNGKTGKKTPRRPKRARQTIKQMVQVPASFVQRHWAMGECSCKCKCVS